eukprot:747512-Hanusia_phi.AAC.3
MCSEVPAIPLACDDPISRAVAADQSYQIGVIGSDHRTIFQRLVLSPDPLITGEETYVRGGYITCDSKFVPEKCHFKFVPAYREIPEIPEIASSNGAATGGRVRHGDVAAVRGAGVGGEQPEVWELYVSCIRRGAAVARGRGLRGRLHWKPLALQPALVATAGSVSWAVKLAVPAAIIQPALVPPGRSS